MLNAGAILGEKYRLLQPFGEQESLDVWCARRIDLDAAVAVEVVPLTNTPIAAKAFRAQARLVASLRCRYVVQLLDHAVDADAGVAFVVMQPLHGETLKARLARQGTLSPTLAARWVAELATALTAAHEVGLVHRRLSAAHCVLFGAGDDASVKLFGLGMARLSEPGVSQGSARQGDLLGVRTDLWRLAALAFECLMGRPPPDRDVVVSAKAEPSAVESALARARVPAGFHEWFAEAMRSDVDRLFESPADMARSFGELVAAAATAPGVEAPSATLASSNEPVGEAAGAAETQRSVAPAPDTQSAAIAPMPVTVADDIHIPVEVDELSADPPPVDTQRSRLELAAEASSDASTPAEPVSASQGNEPSALDSERNEPSVPAVAPSIRPAPAPRKGSLTTVVVAAVGCAAAAALALHWVELAMPSLRETTRALSLEAEESLSDEKKAAGGPAAAPALSDVPRQMMAPPTEATGVEALQCVAPSVVNTVKAAPPKATRRVHRKQAHRPRLSRTVALRPPPQAAVPRDPQASVATQSVRAATGGEKAAESSAAKAELSPVVVGAKPSNVVQRRWRRSRRLHRGRRRRPAPVRRASGAVPQRTQSTAPTAAGFKAAAKPVRPHLEGEPESFVLDPDKR